MKAEALEPTRTRKASRAAKREASTAYRTASGETFLDLLAELTAKRLAGKQTVEADLEGRDESHVAES